MNQPFGQIIACFRCKHAETEYTNATVRCSKFNYDFGAFDACPEFIDRDEETEATK